MGLGSETIALLNRTLDALNHQTSHTQHKLLSAEELKYAQLQLIATVEAAGKLAEAERIWAEAERADKEALWIQAEAEKVERETEKVNAEAEKVRQEAARTRAEMEGSGMTSEW